MTSTLSRQHETPRAPGPEKDQNVAERVLDLLGRPKNLHRVDARKLWDNHYRVNIFCDMDNDAPMGRLRITDSFFVTLTDDGIASEPPIVRKHKG